MIDFQGVSKRYGEQIVLHEASFRINPGERVGIVGPNGTGKSTLFSLLSGESTPDGGTVEVQPSLRLGHLHQYLRPDDDATGLLEHAEGGVPRLAELLRDIHAVESDIAAAGSSAVLLERLGELQTEFERLGGYDIRHRTEAALSGLGFKESDFARPFTSFSGGWQMRAELARVTVAEPEVLMMDEPSNYLDTVAIEWLQRYLRDYQGTLLLISHDRYLLNSLCQVILEVARGETTRYRGNYDDYVAARVKRQETRQAEQAKQDRIRKQAEQFIDRFRAKNTKASQVQSKIKMLERMDRVETIKDITTTGRIRIPAPPHCGQKVVTLQGVGHAYDAERWVVRGIDLEVDRGDKVAFVGLNGTGKTTLLRIVAGHLAAREGDRRLGHKVTAGYQSQEFTETLDEMATAFETVRRVPSNASDQDVRTLLGGFGFSGEAADKRVGVLSGGERVRLAFARLLVSPPSLLILDEPTTHLDIAARESLEAALIDYPGTLCFVSHDIMFLRRVATRIVAMMPPGVVQLPGGYDYYRELLSAGRLTPTPETPVKPAASTSGPKPASRRARAEVVQKYSKARRELKRDVERMEKRIARCEAEQAELAAQFEKADVDYAATNKALAEVQQKLADTVRRWEAYAIELDALEQEYAAQRGG